MTHLLLKSPQRKQRGFLGWGESLRPGDIQPFVGAVALQGAHQLSALHVPQLDSTILTTTGEHLPIGAELDAVDRSLMRLNPRHACPTLYLPPAQLSIAASTHPLVPPPIP